MRIRDRKERRPCTAARFLDKLDVFNVLVCGSASAPTVWGRYAAWLGRTTMAIPAPRALRMHPFVDGPLYITRGDEDTKILALSRALLWAVVAGFPLAWHKSDGGKAVAWIGACISATPSKVVVTIPEDKIQATIDSLKKLRRQNPVKLKSLNQAAGKVMFIAQLIPVIKPFLNSFWKAIGDINRAGCAVQPRSSRNG